MEIATSYRGYTSRVDEKERRMSSVIKDWQKRINHLPGVEIFPCVEASLELS
jgi:hypothetical protein